MSYKKNMSDHEDNEEWKSDNDENFEEGEENSRIDFYRRVCDGCDEIDEEQLALWANERFRHKQVRQVIATNLPSLKSSQQTTETETVLEQPSEVKLVLPKGGWQVQKVVVSEQNDDLPTLISSKLSFENKPPKKKLFGPRENAWKKMPNFFSDVNEASCLPSADTPFKKETKNFDDLCNKNLILVLITFANSRNSKVADKTKRKSKN